MTDTALSYLTAPKISITFIIYIIYDYRYWFHLKQFHRDCKTNEKHALSMKNTKTDSLYHDNY